MIFIILIIITIMLCHALRRRVRELLDVWRSRELGAMLPKANSSVLLDGFHRCGGTRAAALFRRSGRD